MPSPKLLVNTVGIDLGQYLVEVSPKWTQPKIIHQSVLTGKKSIVYRDAQKKGRLTVRIRVYNSDSVIDSISDCETVGFNLYGDATRYSNMIVKDYKPFLSNTKYGVHSSASFVLESEELINNPIIHT